MRTLFCAAAIAFLSASVIPASAAVPASENKPAAAKSTSVKAAKATQPKARGKFSPDVGVDTTATIAPSARRSCGNGSCFNYTLMGVGF